MTDLEKYLEANGVKYVLDDYTPIILVPASEFKEAWRTWSAKVKEHNHKSSWGVRVIYE